MADDGTDLFVKTDSGAVSVIDRAKSRGTRRLSIGTAGLCDNVRDVVYGAPVTHR
jgi:hypothetical protein